MGSGTNPKDIIRIDIISDGSSCEITSARWYRFSGKIVTVFLRERYANTYQF
jgi:hypothetical protein